MYSCSHSARLHPDVLPGEDQEGKHKYRVGHHHRHLTRATVPSLTAELVLIAGQRLDDAQFCVLTAAGHPPPGQGTRPRPLQTPPQSNPHPLGSADPHLLLLAARGQEMSG